ncbi:MAG: hypothetical protein Q4B25_01655, partial [Pseudomonadota bacterium]|nr:hypothetical protein [Pseudomonadota bacterium]
MFQDFNVQRSKSSAGRKRELIYPLSLDLSGNDFPVEGVLRRVFLIKGVIGKLNHAAGALSGTGGLHIISHGHTVALPVVTGRTALKQDIDQNVQLAGGAVLQEFQIRILTVFHKLFLAMPISHQSPLFSAWSENPSTYA